MFRFLFLSFQLFLIASPILAQINVEDNAIYGLNPTLYNGKVYNYFPGVGVKGHQYFDQKDFIEGSISLRDINYDSVLLNYDILNQELILKYTDPHGSNRLLAVSKAWLKKFSIGDDEFSLIKTSEGQKLIVQTLNLGKIQLHILWTKKLVANISFVSESYVFDKKRQTFYLSYKNNLQEYKSIKDILALLDGKAQEKVKSYLKRNKIKARTNSLDQLTKLFNYCNQLDL